MLLSNYAADLRGLSLELWLRRALKSRAAILLATLAGLHPTIVLVRSATAEHWALEVLARTRHGIAALRLQFHVELVETLEHVGLLNISLVLAVDLLDFFHVSMGLQFLVGALS